jgi:hypothetical protein
VPEFNHVSYECWEMLEAMVIGRCRALDSRISKASTNLGRCPMSGALLGWFETCANLL